MDEKTTAEPDQEDAANNGDSSIVDEKETDRGDAANSTDVAVSSPTKRGRGRPQGSKKLKVCVSDINVTRPDSKMSNGGAAPTQKKRGRPKLSDKKPTGETDDNSGSKKLVGEEDSATDKSPRKRGRPKKSLSTSTRAASNAEELQNGGSKVGRRGRPLGSIKRKSDCLTGEGSVVTPRKRGRPSGSNKSARLEKEVSSGKAKGSLSSPKKGRGRPRKSEASQPSPLKNVSKILWKARGRPSKGAQGSKGKVRSGSQPVKRGRPKGSLNKKPLAFKPRPIATKENSGRSRKQPAKRGRPRKYPLPSPEELKKPKVWKPLGRPRKYPRVDPPEGAPTGPRRSRGRPRKSESKKGSHLRKNVSTTLSPPHNPSDGAKRKRGRPPSTPKTEAVTPRKRGRPKGSPNKNKSSDETPAVAEGTIDKDGGSSISNQA